VKILIDIVSFTPTGMFHIKIPKTVASLLLIA